MLVMRGSRLGTGQNISQQLEGVRVLKMVGTNVRDDVIPVTNAIADAKV
ncbi:MAG: hypothetical protein H6925_04435 [Holosporaceae bacterium]|nr:MAG: hypothetical protein H6925_04435 [Holosporaceae bacterium]